MKFIHKLKKNLSTAYGVPMINDPMKKNVGMIHIFEASFVKKILNIFFYMVVIIMNDYF